MESLIFVVKTHFQIQAKKFTLDLAQCIIGNHQKVISNAFYKIFKVYHILLDFITFTLRRR